MSSPPQPTLPGLSFTTRATSPRLPLCPAPSPSVPAPRLHTHSLGKPGVALLQLREHALVATQLRHRRHGVLRRPVGVERHTLTPGPGARLAGTSSPAWLLLLLLGWLGGNELQHVIVTHSAGAQRLPVGSEG